MLGHSSTNGGTAGRSWAEKDAIKSDTNGLQKLMEISDGYYVNVNNADTLLISIAYSKASIAFICLIGSLTAFNALTFSSQLSRANLLCSFNDYLPLGSELRGIVMPVVYYCRFLELSVLLNIVQLLFCLAALICALNRRSNLFLLCYLFLCVTVLVGAIFLTGLLVLNYEGFVRPAVESMLNWVLRNDPSFCQVLEPQLACRIESTHPAIASLQLETRTFEVDNFGLNATVTPTPPPSVGLHARHPPRYREPIGSSVNSSVGTIPIPSTLPPTSNSDAIAMVCGGRSKWRQGAHSPQWHNGLYQDVAHSVECIDYLSSFLIHRNWLGALVVEYALVIAAGLLVTLHALMKNKRAREQMSRRPSSNGEKARDNES